MRPLDRLPSIKAKLGAVIVAAVGVTVVIVSVGVSEGVPPLICAVAAGVVSLGMVQLLARGMTSPLREMASAAAAMARGEHGRTVAAASRDEVGELARAFNTMAAELAEVDRVRRDLVANVSHELRTPISALQAMLENLVDGVEAPDPQTISTMLRQVERLGRLVAQLLDLSRLEAGTVPLQRERFSVADLLEQTAAECRLHAPQVPVAVDVRPPGLTITGDPERMHQVVANLLENAARFSPAGATVRLEARAHNNRAAIAVVDSGPGIPAGEASRVFERFYRADEARSSGTGGAGLGLAIARWIVELHGGGLSHEPVAPTGTRMVIDLPGGRP